MYRSGDIVDGSSGDESPESGSELDAARKWGPKQKRILAGVTILWLGSALIIGGVSHNLGLRQERKSSNPVATQLEAALAVEESPPEDMPEEIRKNLAQVAALDSPWTVRTPGTFIMRSALNIHISGFKDCSQPFEGNVYYPEYPGGEGDAMEPMPVISWAHGFTQGGTHVDTCRAKDGVIRPLVERGFVVIAFQTGGLRDYCDTSHDQIRMLQWARTSSFADRIDFSVAILGGYSMGGKYTLKAASNRWAVQEYNIKAAFVVNPHCVGGCKHPVVPTYYSTGSRDLVAPAWLTYRACKATPRVPRYFAKFKNSHVISVWQGKYMLSPPIISFCQCYAKYDENECEKLTHIYASGLPDLDEFEHFYR